MEKQYIVYDSYNGEDEEIGRYDTLAKANKAIRERIEDTDSECYCRIEEAGEEFTINVILNNDDTSREIFYNQEWKDFSSDFEDSFSLFGNQEYGDHMNAITNWIYFHACQIADRLRKGDKPKDIVKDASYDLPKRYHGKITKEILEKIRAFDSTRNMNLDILTDILHDLTGEEWRACVIHGYEEREWQGCVYNPSKVEKEDIENYFFGKYTVISIVEDGDVIVDNIEYYDLLFDGQTPEQYVRENYGEHAICKVWETKEKVVHEIVPHK